MKKSIMCGIIFLGITAFIILLLIITPHTLPKQNANLRTIEDMAGNKVQIPYEVHRVVTAMYPIATQLVFIAGAQDKLVGISDYDINDTMKKIYPRIEGIYRPVRYNNGDITVEETIKMEPDVLFLSKRNPQNAHLSKLGIPTVFLMLENPEQLMQGIMLVGEIMQKKERARLVINYFKKKLDYIHNKTSMIKNKKKIYYAGPNMLSTAGGDFYQNFIIEYAGGINVARDNKGGWSNISVEQLIAWNPDFIFMGKYGTARVENFMDDKRLKVISAVESKEVYMSPHYIGSWDVPNPESILGIMWLANKLYPREISFDMKQEMKKFYTVCYGYTPDNKEIARVLGE
jgi:iron complex transport system substrate-binding protein